MALRQEVTRLFIADDVGVGKTIEALLIIRELLERRIIKRFAVLCLPHLCEQWQEEIRAKLDIDPVIIRTNTQAALDRRIQGDTSVFQYYPFQIISIDYIKSDARCNLFIQECPELLIVDEVHTCARPSGAAPTQQQRHHLLSRLAANPVRHLVLLTATPHSGKPEEFQSLLGLIHSDFAGLDLPTSSPSERKRLARHFIQRKRADVEKWMGEDTPFPRRESFEYPYQLAEEYANFFDDLLDFTRKMVVPDPSGGRFQRVRYWSALALLRGVMSSPGAGVAMLNTRLEGITLSEDNETDANPVSDTDFGFDGDYLPTQVLERADWSEYQRRQLRDFARRLDALGNARMDQKLARLAEILKDWLRDGLKPVIFCRYIETARYLGDRLPDLLRKNFPRLELRAVTSEDPDDVRRQRIEEMAPHEHRVLIATDCLSEGVNLQSLFTAVLHYDLPWNPNRLEQREGRVD
ncbi:MAG TPA: helicase-related protein, partial [Candidatus Sumerlaeota bacterium]|nr:helicase-related protein [Candidatus Sumerlaeota bacterium]